MVTNRWKDSEARQLVAAAGAVPADRELALRVYTSRLIGADPDLVMHGGGNTSVKLERQDVFGEVTKVLHVKGSGWDLGTIEVPGLPAVRLEPLRRLRELTELSDEDMVNMQRCNLLDAAAPTPSVETLLHAYLPHTYVDHTHASVFLVLANLPDCAALTREIFGDRLAVVPYIMPGFKLAKAAAKAFEDNPGVEGLLLANHGHFTFGATARESYERVIRHTNMVGRWLKKRAGFVPSFAAASRAGKLRPAAAKMLPLLRGAIGDALAAHTGNRDVAMPVFDLRCGPATMKAVGRKDARALACLGVGTPDHVIRTKGWPLVLSKADLAGGRAALATRIGEYVAGYRKYFRRQVRRFAGGKTMLAPTPNVAWLPGVGLVGIGVDAKAARVAADIGEQSLQVWSCGKACGDFAAIGEKDLFEMEYWSLEQAKLGKGSPLRLRGQVVLVTGGAGAIGMATAKSFAGSGAEVFLVDRDAGLLAKALQQCPSFKGCVVDVTTARGVTMALAACLAAFGGLDILVSNAGAAWVGEMIDLPDRDLRASFELNFFAHRAFGVAAAKVFAAQGRGGQILLNVSKQAVNPGKGFGAYGLPKAASMFLVKQLALELGAQGVRVNGLNPDRIRSGLLNDDFIVERAKARGVSIADYMANNLVKREVEAHHVGDAFVALALCERTTAHILPVDGGNIEASLR